MANDYKNQDDLFSGSSGAPLDDDFNVSSVERHSRKKKINIDDVPQKPKPSKYDDGTLKVLPGIIKGIAFIIAFGLIVLAMFAALCLYTKKILGSAVCVAIVLAGTLLAVLAFFPLYGIGYLITQNNEILKKLDK